MTASGTLILDFFDEMYFVLDNCFEKGADSQILNKVWDTCREVYARTYFRHEKKQTLHQSSWLDINNHFYALAQRYWGIIAGNHVDRVIFDDVPHLGGAVIIYHLCKVLNIETIVCSHGFFADTFLVARNIESLGLDTPGNDWEKPSVVMEEQPSTPVYMPKKLGMSRFQFIKGYAYHASHIAAKTMTLSFFWNKASLEKSKRKLLRHMEAFAIQNSSSGSYSEYDSNASYIYFPLHLQPEMSTDIFGGRYADQILAIEELARKLPEGMAIYVKENPKQSTYMRDPSFYKRLLAIPPCDICPSGFRH